MIAVDTSVWIDFFRGRQPVTEKLTELLDRDEVVLPIPVRIEILSGARSSERSRLGRLLSALPVLYPSDASWKRVETWVTTGAARGYRFGFSDLLIAAVAADNGCSLWSLDNDFSRMARIGIVTRAKV
jgi:predicted nucleic acid-binding protein